VDRISSASVLHRWGLIGDSLGVPADWAAVRSLINAVESYSQAHREELRRLLHQSDAKLNPLCDPLAANLGLNRWLAAEREEAYSDWLAWVLQQLTPAQLLSLFDIQLNLQSLDPLLAPIVRREVRILDGCRRLDIEVAFGHDMLLVIEVKIVPEQESDTRKNKEYKRWIDSQKYKNKKQVLLAREISYKYREALPGGFAPVLWDDFCIRLRRMLMDPNFRAGKGLTITALMVAFIGAVEEILLAFASPDSDYGRSPRYASTAEHLKKALS
jgi:hypothetical protein